MILGTQNKGKKWVGEKTGDKIMRVTLEGGGRSKRRKGRR